MVREILKALKRLLIDFVRPVALKDKLLDIPKDVKSMGIKRELMGLGFTLLSMLFSFLLKMTNSAIEQKMIFLGVALFFLYRGQQLINTTYRMFSNNQRNRYSLILDNEISLRGSMIVGKTANKVLKYDKRLKVYKTLSNEEVLNTTKNYLKNYWEYKVIHFFNILSLVSTMVMIVVAIITNDSVKQEFFIPIIGVFVLLSLLSSAYIKIKREDSYDEFKAKDNEQTLIINDLLRVPTVVKKDLDMRISRFQKSVKEGRESRLSYEKKIHLTEFLRDVIDLLCQYGIIIFYLIGVDWNSITLSSIAEITAVLAIVETALRYVNQIVGTIDWNNEKMTTMDKEDEDITLILDTYHSEEHESSKIVDKIFIAPFFIKYIEESDNDKPFQLVSTNKIIIYQGEVVVLYGPSGSGKSTFMKMLTERIKLEKNVDVPSTDRYLFYDEKLKFGSLSIFEELFCTDPNPDLDKMQEILENLYLWVEISSNCKDIWTWMKEKKFEQSLSNGQKQRLILAKLLYFLDENIDVLVLDECTSGLDDKADEESADAERILEYIVKYANADKKRIVIISTHQNIDGFKEKMSGTYTFKNLYFKKGDGYSFISE